VKVELKFRNRRIKEFDFVDKKMTFLNKKVLNVAGAAAVILVACNNNTPNTVILGRKLNAICEGISMSR